MDSVHVLGVRVDCVDTEGALAAIERLVDAGPPVSLAATINPEFVMRARKDAEFKRVLGESALCLPDGIGVVWAMRRLGCRGQRRVAGSDLLPLVCELCARRTWRPFFLGARPGVAAEAARRLQERIPGLEVGGVYSGSPGPEGDEDSLRAIEQARPDVLFVAYGHPRQEQWVDRNRARLRVPVAMGVGGSFDFAAGRARRAPVAFQRLHLEWLWRLAIEPWRLRRMSVLPAYAVNVLRGVDH